MNQKTIISLAIIGAVLIAVIIGIKEAAEVFKDHTNIAWFILGFGSCMVIEAIFWGIMNFIKRRIG